uniref:Kelch domain containing 2 n=1 Tax=Xenopus tropicalis TaxID=8364 RepID=A0A6I8SD32_XENTR
MADENEQPPADADGEEEEEEDDDDDLVDESIPAERSGHVAVTDGQSIFVWGGYKVLRGDWGGYVIFTDIYIQRVKTKGEIPLSMSGSCAACVDKVLYLFGGHHAHGNTNMFYMLNLNPRDGDLFWEKVDCKGIPPSPKDKLGVWTYKNK